MFSILALGSAALYGAADFIGGITSRRADTIAIVVISQGAGLVLVALFLPFLAAASPGRSDWIWGGIAGLTGGVGVALLYRALAVGIMTSAAVLSVPSAAVLSVPSAALLSVPSAAVLSVPSAAVRGRAICAICGRFICPICG
jgi:uncharacterized membrane protein